MFFRKYINFLKYLFAVNSIDNLSSVKWQSLKFKADAVCKLKLSHLNLMLSVIINKSVQTDPILINDFSRIAPLISNKLNGAPNPTRPKSINVAMAEQKRGKNVESASNSSNNHGGYSRIRPVVSSRLPRAQNERKQDKRRPEESINFNTFPYQVASNNYMVQQHFHNHAVGPPFFQTIPWQTNNYSVYRNFFNPVLQPNSSQTCFHRLNQEGQHRQVQTSTRSVKDTSLKGLRFWEQLAPRGKNKGFVFSVMSYNVLAQDLIDQHPYLYTHHRKDTLVWPVRWNNLLSEIKEFHPDILCLQEVQGSHLQEYFSHLNHLGYRGLYKQRTGPRTDGCAIYYKDDQFNLVEHTTVEYLQPNVRILDRDNVAIIAKFSPKQRPDKEFIVATTHLLYNPKRQDVRLAQTQLLLTEIERIAFSQRGYLPIIITGDLNSTPDSAIYQFITRGRLRYENLLSRSLVNSANGPKTGKNFLPSSLRITDQCQHADLLEKRQSEKFIPREEELKLIELKHSERVCENNKNKVKNQNDANLFSSGTLSHKFFLKSVYEHVVNGDVEGTTYQDEWRSVDYIFYSKKTDTGKLTLLERYRLPTKSQLGDVKIPNGFMGSDHLSLLAKFKLNF